ncbi:signal-transducing histidine kinase/response regulator [Natrinema limicola JCM 13563]|uniref:histidine kinase n=2 Tax=Natrinema limicola TaxID=370323 RepID=M0CIA8_9EURY|nr:signal-transducing histidine kinase/response regulator [Natrinema limicola JCM 13563]
MVSWWRTHAGALVGVAGGVGGLYIIQLQNFLLFHSLVELGSILIAAVVFLITWNAREELDRSFLVILGVSYLFVAGVDLLHVLTYKGMGVFPSAGPNLPTQLWVLGRYLEAGSLLAAGIVGLVLGERDDLEWSGVTLCALVMGYAAVVGLGLGSIVVVDWFPQMYVDGSGLTRAKVGSEYVVIALFAASLGLLYGQRETFNRRLFQFLAGSILLTMGAELAFTFYVDVYGISNAVGHFLKLASFYLIYLSVVKMGIKEPQKTLYRALAKREAEARKFKKAADYSGHAVLITDRDGTIQYVNSAWEAITGYSAAEARGRNPRLLNSGEHDEAFYDELWSTILAGNIWEGEIVNERRDGDRYVIHQTIAPIFDEDGTIQSFVAIHDDITDQKVYQRQLETDLHQSVTQLQVLARVLRHNIRNEMNVIAGNAEMIQEQSDDTDDIASMAGRIVDASDQLLAQADKQREIVRLLSAPSTTTTLELSAVVDEIVSQLEQQYSRAEITTDVPADLVLRTLPELEQAIVEVVENAIVHTECGTPAVTISARSRDRLVEIQVEDNGPGIPAAERQVIAGDAEIDALLHSNGMGLWLVDHIVMEAGGTIRFEDAQSHGSIVTLTLPRNGTLSNGSDSSTPIATTR